MSASAAIRVCVLEGNYARMPELGLPLSLAVELQSRNLRLDSSLWTARSSNGGYSVSFFWPSLQRKRRRHRRQRKPPNNHPATTTTNLLSTYLPPESGHLSNTSGPASGNSKFVPLIPSNAHHSKKTRAPSNPVATLTKEPDASHSKLNESSTGDENTRSSVESADPPSQSTALDSDSQQHVDLKACTDVKYEKRGGVHGVVVQQHDNNQTWTPVCGKRRKRIPLSEAQLRRIPPPCRHPPPSDDDSSSESDIPLTCTIPENATVNYKVVDGTPGLSIATRKTRHWTPIASRTRARTRNSATKS